MPRVLVKPSPLRQARDEVTVPAAGLTIQQIVELVLPDELARAHAIVEHGGRRVPRHLWRTVRPKEHAHLLVLVAPGGGVDGLRTVLQIGVTVAAIAAFVLLAPYLTPIGAGAVAATIQAGGYLAINAFLPPAQPKLGGGGGRSSPAYAFDGARNEIRKWAPVPVLLGRCRMFPPFGAEPITEIEGDKNYLNLLLMWSRGKVELEALHVGDTPLADYREVEVETVQADPDTAPALTLFPSDPTTLLVGASLTFAGGFVTRRSARDADRLVIEVLYPGGLQGIGEKTGDRFGQSVTYQVETSPAGENLWTSRGSFTQGGKTSSAIRRAIAIDVARGQYDVRIKRTTADASDPYHINAGEWLTLRSITYRSPTRAKSRTATALRILATSQLSGTLDTVNAWGTSICLDFEATTGTWTPRATRNPASLFRFALQSFGRSKFLDEEIDLARLEYWHERNTARGYTCDLYVDFKSTLLEVLRIIAQCGRARPTRVDGKWSVVIDEPQGGPVQYFTPRNMVAFSARKLFVKEFHGFRVTFLDAEQGMRPDEVVAYRDGYDEATATELPELEAPGITDRALAWTFGRWSIAQILLRPEEYEVETDWQHVVCTAGDEVAIQHDSLSIGTAWGVVKSVETAAGGLLKAVVLDERVTMEPGRAYALVVRRPGAADLVLDAVTSAVGAPAARVELDGAYSATDAPAAGDLVMLGERGKVTLPAVVKAVIPGPDLTARLLCVPAAWVDENEPIPAFDPRVTAPSGELVPIILRIRSDSTVLARDADGTVHLELVVSLYSDGTRSLTRIAGLEVWWALQDHGGSAWLSQSYPADTTEVRLPGIQTNAWYLVAARFRFTDGTDGPWTGDVAHFVEGVTLPPPAPTTIFVDGDAVAWLYPDPPPDHDGFRVGVLAVTGLPASQARPLTDGLVREQRVPVASLPLDTREVLVWAVSTAGLASALPIRLTVAPDPFSQRVRWRVDDLKAQGWPGALAAATVEPETGDLVAIDTSLWLDPPDGRWLDPPEGPWLAGTFQAVEYILTYPIPAGVKPTDRVWIESEQVGTWTFERRWAGDLIERARDDEPIPAWLLQADRRMPLGSRMLGGETTAILEPGILEPGIVEDGSDPTTSIRPWLPWVQGLRPVAGETLTLRARSAAATDGLRPRLSALRLVIDAAEVEEVIGPVDLPAEGYRPTPSLPFRGFRWVHAQKALLLTDDTGVAGGGYDVVLADPLPATTPPRVRAFDAASRQPTTGRVILTLGGY